MGWELIGGDPAPGSPDAVGAAVTALGKVADLASDARTNLVTQTGAAGIERWKGSAADAFRADVGKLPGMLDEVTTSYREAAGGLQSYRYTLDGAQAEARAILAAAQQAQSDLDTAQARKNSAQSELDGLNSQHRNAQLHLAGLQSQQALSIDPVHRASLTSPITSARSQVNRLQGDISSTQQTVNRYQQAMNDAQGRLDDARRRAQGIRDRISGAADQAAAVLKRAERDAHLPNWFQRTTTDLKKELAEYGPILIQALDEAQFVLQLAALIPTPLSPFLEGASLFCGGAALLLSIGVDAIKPGGITTTDLLDLGARTLTLAAGGATLGVMKSAGTATKSWKVAQTVLNDGADSLNVAENAEKQGGGVQGFLFAAGTYVVGKGGSAAVVKGLGAAEKNPTFNRYLSKSVDTLTKERSLPGTHLDVPVEGPHPAPTSLGGSGSPPGESDFAHKSEDFIDKLTGKGSEKASDILGEHMPAQAPPDPEPEIDINLFPSPYGAGR